MNRLFPAIKNKKKKLQSLTLCNHHFNYYNFRTHTSPIIGLKQKVWCPQRDKWQWVLSHMLAIITTIWSDAVLHFCDCSIGVLIAANFSEGLSESWKTTLSSPYGTRALTQRCGVGGHSCAELPWASTAPQGEKGSHREGAQCQQPYWFPKS